MRVGHDSPSFVSCTVLVFGFYCLFFFLLSYAIGLPRTGNRESGDGA